MCVYMYNCICMCMYIYIFRYFLILAPNSENYRYKNSPIPCYISYLYFSLSGLYHFSIISYFIFISIKHNKIGGEPRWPFGSMFLSYAKLWDRFILNYILLFVRYLQQYQQPTFLFKTFIFQLHYISLVFYPIPIVFKSSVSFYISQFLMANKYTTTTTTTVVNSLDGPLVKTSILQL